MPAGNTSYYVKHPPPILRILAFFASITPATQYESTGAIIPHSNKQPKPSRPNIWA